MKKKIIIIAAIVVVLAVMLVPIPAATYDDGGTREYKALFYKIVDWNRLTEDGIYEKTRVYFGDDRKKSIDELWDEEAPEPVEHFRATIIELNGDMVVVEPVEGEGERLSCEKIAFSTKELERIEASVGSVVEITYVGLIAESSPGQITATSWALSKNYRHLEYTDEWLDKEAAEIYHDDFFGDIVITEIYSNCFFARSVIPMPYTIKLNGTLSEDWCVGDQVVVTYDEAYYDRTNHRIEVDFLTVKVGTFEMDPNACYKPVIYLYPEIETEVSVKLELNGELTCTYPSYKDGWKVTAVPDGTLTDAQGQIYNYLYWEGETYSDYDMSQGFCIKGEDTAAFLEDALAKLGLNRKEANEFIVYWLPIMQNNPYNIIAFQTDTYTDAAKLSVNPAPDTLIRVFMTWKAADSYVELTEQILTAPERQGFTVVEWGGTELIGD